MVVSYFADKNSLSRVVVKLIYIIQHHFFLEVKQNIHGTQTIIALLYRINLNVIK